MRGIIETRALVDSENMLTLTTDQRVMVDINDARWDFGSSGFTISYCKIPSTTSGWDFHLNHVASNVELYATNSGTTFVIRSNQSTVYTFTGSSFTTFPDRMYRITFTRLGSAGYLYVNNKLQQSLSIPLTQTFNIYNSLNRTLQIGGKHTSLGSGLDFKGKISNFIVIGFGMTATQVESLHTTNAIPTSLHQYVTAHFPMNHTDGNLVLDISGNYNYAKVVNCNIITPTLSNTGVVSNDLPHVTETIGSDSDGTYLEVELTSGFTNNTTTYIGGVLSVALTSPLRYYNKYKFKIMTTGTTIYTVAVPNGSAIYYTGSETNLKLIEVEHSGQFPSGGGQASGIIGFQNGVAGNKVRLYSLLETTAFPPKSARLLDFSDNEIGNSNSLLQTVWPNIYNKSKTGKYFLNQTSTSQWAEITSLANRPLTQDFIIYGQLYRPSGTTQAFSFYFGDSGAVNRMQLNSDVTSLTGTYFYTNQVAGPMQTCAADTITGSTLNFVIAHKYESGFSKLRIYSMVNGKPTGNFIRGNNNSVGYYQYNVARWLFFSPNALSFNYPGLPQSYIGYIEDPFTTYPLTFTATPSDTLPNRLINILLNAHKTDEYKSVSKLFHLDFGDVFPSGSSYYVRDNSGNNRHAILSGFTPTINQPLLIERNKFLPKRGKALKLNGTNQYVSIANFNPTKESGYTYIAMFQNMADIPIGIQPVVGKRGSVVQGMFINPTNVDGNTTLQMWYNTFGGLITDPKIHSSPIVAAYTVSSNKTAGYINGNLIVTGGSLTLVGFDENGNASLRIGEDNGWYYKGLFSHVSIYKNYLSRQEIRKITNGLLSGNIDTSSIMDSCQLYVNFEEIINDGGTYKLRDWSPQKRTVVLNNFSANEINPSNVEYKLFDISTTQTGHDAQKFIDTLTRAGISLSSTQQNAIYKLTNSLKSVGVWNKSYAIYPFIGGNATGHTYNLKDPRNVDAAYRLSFVGGWTHTASGATPNGTTGYARTFFIENSKLVKDSQATIGTYSRTNSTGTKTNIGAYGAVGATLLRERDGSNNVVAFVGSTAGSVSVPIADSLGWILLTRKKITGNTDNSIATIYKGTTVITGVTVSDRQPTSVEFYIGALNVNGSATQFSDRQICFAFIGDYLTDYESKALATAVQEYNTYLNREV